MARNKEGKNFAESIKQNTQIFNTSIIDSRPLNDFIEKGKNGNETLKKQVINTLYSLQKYGGVIGNPHDIEEYQEIL